MSSVFQEFDNYSDEELIRAVVGGSGWESEDTPELPSASDSTAELPAPIHLEFRDRFEPTLRRAARSVGYSEEKALNTVLEALLYGTRSQVRIDGTGMFDGEFFRLAKCVCDGQRKPSNLSPSELDRLAEGAGGRTVRKRLEEMLNELEQSERSPRFIDYMPEQSLSGISSPTDELREFLGDLLNQRWTREEEIEDEVEQLTGKEEYSSLHEDLLEQARRSKRASESVSFASAESGLFEKYDRSQEGDVGGWLSKAAKWLFGHCRDRREDKAVEQRSFHNQGQSSQQQGTGQTGPVADTFNDPSNAPDDLDESHISRRVPKIAEFVEGKYGLDLSSDLGISGELYENPIETKIELIDWLSSEHQQWFGTTHYYTVPICYRKALEEVELPALRYQFLGADSPADLDHTGDLDPPASEVRTFYMDQWHNQVRLEIRENGGEQTPNRATIGNWVKRGRDDFKKAIKEEWRDSLADALIDVFHVDKNRSEKNGD
ncbi:hypothetical protein GGP81_003244 [Salinibacter ruber]|uniref:hypothetical protein n=1 Tax=Salinibacter ruber TaxID=146919 RepID=UPI0021681B49|nr:hypothetical protein [Salinibacter ruber]MCS3956696.1 hypothetical protein [Salinibacter ruber]